VSVAGTATSADRGQGQQRGDKERQPGGSAGHCEPSLAQAGSCAVVGFELRAPRRFHALNRRRRSLGAVGEDQERPVDDSAACDLPEDAIVELREPFKGGSCRIEIVERRGVRRPAASTRRGRRVPVGWPPAYAGATSRGSATRDVGLLRHAGVAKASDGATSETIELAGRCRCPLRGSTRVDDNVRGGGQGGHQQHQQEPSKPRPSHHEPSRVRPAVHKCRPDPRAFSRYYSTRSPPTLRAGAVAATAPERTNFMVAAVIINPAAGRARRRLEPAERIGLAERVLAGRGVVARVHVSAGAGHAFSLAAEEVARGCDLVFAWGGDGTVNEVGRALVNTRCVLAVIPAGSGNGLARELGVPAEPAGAMACGLDSRPRAIDAGEIGGRLFFNAAGIGLDAHVAWCFARSSDLRRGLTGYVKTTALELWRYRAEQYTIVAGGRETRTEAMIVAFANSAQYGNGARIAPEHVSTMARSTWSCGWQFALDERVEGQAALRRVDRTRSARAAPTRDLGRRRGAATHAVSRRRRTARGRLASRGGSWHPKALLVAAP